MKHSITLYEFGWSKKVGLSPKVIRSLININERFAKKGHEIIKISPTGEEGTYKLKAYNYVGVIQSGNTRIQILPKLYKKGAEKKEAKVESLKNLHYMLSFTRMLPISETSQSMFHRYRDDFLEIYISIFLKELEETLRSNIFRQYVELEDNLTIFRGRIAINQHIKENIVKNNPVKIYCEFDELTEDNLINQTIKYTLSLLGCVSQSYSNLDRLNQLLFTLAEISDRKIRPEDEKRIHFNRINKSFKPVIEKCFLFINNFSIDLMAGATNYGAILFDMNELFEEFVANFIIRNKKEVGVKQYEIEPQKRLDALDKSGSIKLRPDLVLSQDSNAFLIIDTKYKVLDLTKKNQGISNSDIYQMLAYGLRGNCPKIVLLYPRPENFGSDDMDPIKIPLYAPGGCSHEIPEKVEIYARTIDIMRDDLKKERGEIVQNLRMILDECGVGTD